MDLHGRPNSELVKLYELVMPSVKLLDVHCERPIGDGAPPSVLDLPVIV